MQPTVLHSSVINKAPQCDVWSWLSRTKSTKRNAGLREPIHHEIAVVFFSGGAQAAIYNHTMVKDKEAQTIGTQTHLTNGRSTHRGGSQEKYER